MKLCGLYKSLGGLTPDTDQNSNENSDVADIKGIWKWIKSLVKYRESNQAKSKKINAESRYESEYEELCNNIMKENNISDLEELKVFLNRAVANYTENKRKVNKIKELLLKEPSSGSRAHSRDIHTRGKINSMYN
jgi:hypothetical protein